MITVLEFILLILSIILVGIGLGLVERKHKQKHYCHYCSCGDHCVIGISVPLSRNTDLVPFACQARGKK